VIGVVYALVGLLAVATGGLVTFAVMNSRAQSGREGARVLATSVSGELARAKDTIARDAGTIQELAENLKREQERADALDDELAESYKSPDPVGARERVLQAWTDARDAARGRRTIALSTPSAARPTGPDGLLDPFDGDS